MALSEENLADLNQSQGFVSEAKENGAKPATRLDPLVNLLLDLKILEQAEKANVQLAQPTKDSSQVVLDSIICSENNSPATLIPSDSNLENLGSEVAEDEPDPLASLLFQLEKLTEPTLVQRRIYKQKDTATDVVEEGQSLPFLSDESAVINVLATAIEELPNLVEEQKSSVLLTEDLEDVAAQHSNLPNTVVEDSQVESADKKPQTLEADLEDVTITQDVTIPWESRKPPLNQPEMKSIPVWSQPVETKALDVLVNTVEELPNRREEQPAAKLEAEKSQNSLENSEESMEAIDRLQNLIFGSKISELDEVKTLLADTDLPGVRHLMATIEHKLGNLEHQIYDPQELIALLLPWIGEILGLKISESKEEIIKVMVPIIDEVIKAKTQQDKQAMSSAIADLLPEAISQQIKNSPQEMANAIAPEIAIAIREQIRLDQESIAEALAPEMGKAIKAQIELERDAMVDALYPVIGNTIAKYLTEAIRTINEKVANAFSVEGVQRKIRAQMQGVSEAELILRESIPFTIQAVFLIHKASGLVIAEVQPENKQKLESDMIAGMLTAIRSFVNDCISQSGEIAELNEIDYGDSKIILEVAGYCYLAVVIKGEQPKEFINKMRETLSTIIMKYSKPIEFYDGDPDKIPEQLQGLLERIFKLGVKEKETKAPNAILGIGLVVSTLILVPWGMYQHRQGIERRIETNTNIALSNAPDLAVYRLGVDVNGESLRLTGKLPNQGLRAKAEKIAKAIAPTLKVDNKIIAVDVPPDPVIVTAEVKRVTAVLNQIEGVAISSRYGDRKVTVEGTVMQITDAQKIAQSMKQIPGIQSVISTVKLNPLKITTRIYFDAGSTTLNSGYGEIIDNVKEFLKQYPQKQLKIIGHSDRQGNAAINQRLAQQRAEAVRIALVQQGVDPRRLQVVASSNPPADVESSQPLLLSRCVVFEPITKGIKSK